MSDTDTGGTDAPATDGPPGAGLAILLAMIVFGVSLVAVPAAIAVGAPLTWAVASNLAAAAAIVAWTARRSFRDPDSSVTTVPGAFGTALLVIGGYALVVGGLVALTAPWHRAGFLAVPVGGGGAAVALLGLATFAFEVVFGESADTGGQSPDGAAGRSDDRE